MSSATVNNTMLEYIEAGKGQPLVLVHGSASDYRTWEIQFQEFRNHFRTIKYSRRYHWPNQQISEDEVYAMPEQVDDLASLLSSLNAVPAHIVGHSYGAFLSLLLAIKKPSLVRSLVLSEPPVISLFVSNTPNPLEILKLLVFQPKTGFAIIKFAAKGLVPAQKAFKRGDTEDGVRLFGKAVLGSEYFDKLSEQRKQQIVDNSSSAKAELLGPGFAPLEAEQLREVDIPVLLTSGENSPALFQCLTDHLQKLLPNAERLIIPGASHNMHEDNPTAYNDSVLSILKVVA